MYPLPLLRGTPLFRGKGHFLWVPNPSFTLHSGDTLTTQTVTDPKEGGTIKFDMPVKKLPINTASETVRVAEELMDYAMFTGNKQLSDLSLR